jgi:hypothetical protein
MYLSFSLDFQSFVFSSPNLQAGNSPEYNLLPYPTGYDQSCNYALALAGFNFNMKQIIAFDVLIHAKTATHYNMTFEAKVDVACYALRYYVLITKPSAAHFSLTT